jgi:hypothetical protein
LIHWLAGLCIKIPTCGFLSGFTKQRTEIDPEYDERSMRALFGAKHRCNENEVPSQLEPWKYKRISVQVDGCLIDAMLIVRDSTAENGKWFLHSNTNSDFYELHKHYTTTAKKLAFSLDTNILLFNHPGVGASQGSFTRETIAKTYQTMLHFLEDKERGIGANTIIAKGFCLGGNIQGEALKDYELQPEIKYVFIKDRSAFDFSKAASRVSLCWIGKLLDLCGWNMDTLSSSKRLVNAHEILLHTAGVTAAEQITDPDLLIDDGVLAKEETLGYHILKNQDQSFTKKLENTTVLGIPEFHCNSLSHDTLSVLSKKIKVILEGRDSDESDSDYGDVVFEGEDVLNDPALEGEPWQ